MDIQDTVKGMPWTRRPASGRPVDLIDLRRAGVPLTGEIIKHGVRLVTDSVLQATAEAFAKARLR